MDTEVISMSWLLYTVLQWTGYRCLFMILILFSLHKYPEVELLNHKVFLTFCGNFILFSNSSCIITRKHYKASGWRWWNSSQAIWILEDDAGKVLHLMSANWSVFHFNSKEGQSQKCLIYQTVVLISYVSMVMFKILQARLQQYVNWEFPDGQAGFRKGRGTRNQIANILWIIEKAREFQKDICFTDYARDLDCVDHTNCGKFKRWEY